MPQDECFNFLEENKPQKYTAREVWINLLKNRLKEGRERVNFEQIMGNLRRLCKCNKISYDTCIVKGIGRGDGRVKKIYWIDNSGMSISPITHIEDIPSEEMLTKLKISPL